MTVTVVAIQEATCNQCLKKCECADVRIPFRVVLGESCLGQYLMEKCKAN